MRTVRATGAPIVLNEYEKVRVIGLRPSPGDLLAAESEVLARRLGLRWLHDGSLEVSAGPHVGVVALDCVALHVHPKLVGGELAVLQMLDYASGLPALRELEYFQRLGEGLHLRDLVCLLLARECDRLLRQGPRRDYLRREGTLPALRGRLLADRQVLRRHGRLDRIECRYDELSSDIPDNRLCSAALHRAARTAEDTTVRAHCRRLAADFADLCDADGFDPQAAESRLIYHRANEHYRHAHRWALLLLRGSAFADLYAAAGPSLQTFMLDMNTLFEAFVTRLLRDAARGTGIAVQAQRALPGAISNESGRTYTSVRPDLLLVQGHGPTTRRVPIDAKYKLYADKKIASGDLYQSFIYALSTSAAEQPSAYVLYAADKDIPSRHITLHRPGSVPAAHLTSIAVNVPAVLTSLATGAGRPAIPDTILSCLSFGKGDAADDFRRRRST